MFLTQMRVDEGLSAIVPNLLGDEELVEGLGHSGSEMWWAVW